MTSRFYTVNGDQVLSALQEILSPKYSTLTEYFRRPTKTGFKYKKYETKISGKYGHDAVC